MWRGGELRLSLTHSVFCFVFFVFHTFLSLLVSDDSWSIAQPLCLFLLWLLVSHSCCPTSSVTSSSFATFSLSFPLPPHHLPHPFTPSCESLPLLSPASSPPASYFSFYRITHFLFYPFSLFFFCFLCFSLQ